MKDTFLIYDNSLMHTLDFINSILHPKSEKQLPTCEIKETSNFYYINIDSFYDDTHVLEISYKDNFLILKFMLNNDLNEFLFQRSFYLLKIDLNNILLHDYKDSIKLIIPKVA